MARTSSKPAAKKITSTSTVDAPVLDTSSETASTSTKHAFQLCFSVDPDSRFNSDIPEIFFIRPNIMMKALLEDAGEFAKSKGVESICQHIKTRDDTGQDSDSDSEYYDYASVSSGDTLPPPNIVMTL